MNVQFLNPPALCPTFGWTHVVTITGGKTIHISGQVGIDERGAIVGKGDLGAQTEQAFRNIESALTAVGATFQHVVNTSLFVVGLKPVTNSNWLHERCSFPGIRIKLVTA